MTRAPPRRPRAARLTSAPSRRGCAADSRAQASHRDRADRALPACDQRAVARRAPRESLRPTSRGRRASCPNPGSTPPGRVRRTNSANESAAHDHGAQPSRSKASTRREGHPAARSSVAGPRLTSRRGRASLHSRRRRSLRSQRWARVRVDRRRRLGIPGQRRWCSPPGNAAGARSCLNFG